MCEKNVEEKLKSAPLISDGRAIVGMFDVTNGRLKALGLVFILEEGLWPPTGEIQEGQKHLRGTQLVHRMTDVGNTDTFSPTTMHQQDSSRTKELDYFAGDWKETPADRERHSDTSP